MLRLKEKVSRNQKGSHNIFKQKEVDIDWIYELCKDQGILELYNRLVYDTKMNSTLDLPIASMKKVTDVNDIPKRLEGAPSIQFIQSAGTCGLSSFSSAFHEYFNKSIASEWMRKV